MDSRRLDAHHCRHAVDLRRWVCITWYWELPGVGYDKHIEAIPIGWRDLSAHVIDAANAYRKETGH